MSDTKTFTVVVEHTKQCEVTVEATSWKQALNRAEALTQDCDWYDDDQEWDEHEGYDFRVLDEGRYKVA